MGEPFASVPVLKPKLDLPATVIQEHQSVRTTPLFVDGSCPSLRTFLVGQTSTVFQVFAEPGFSRVAEHPAAAVLAWTTMQEQGVAGLCRAISRLTHSQVFLSQGVQQCFFLRWA